MAKVTIAKQAVLGPYPTLQPAANALDIAFTACDVALGNQFTPSGNDLLLVLNSDGANPYTFTIASVVDEKNRTGDITTYSLGANEYAAFYVKKAGWQQADGFVYINGLNAAIKFAILQLP